MTDTPCPICGLYHAVEYDPKTDRSKEVNPCKGNVMTDIEKIEDLANILKTNKGLFRGSIHDVGYREAMAATIVAHGYRKNTQELVALDTNKLFNYFNLQTYLSRTDREIEPSYTTMQRLAEGIVEKFGTPPVPSVEEIGDIITNMRDDFRSHKIGSYELAQAIHTLLTKGKQ